MKARSDITAFAALVVLGWVFGAAFLFMKVLVDETSPGAVLLGRLVFGSLVVWAFLALRPAPMSWRPAWLAQVTALAMLQMVIPYLLIPWAEIEIDSGVASVLISAMPLFTALLAAALLPDETLTRRQKAGLAIGFAGVIVVSGAGAGSLSGGSIVATLAVVFSAASYAAAVVYAKVLLRRSEPVGLTGQQMLMGTLVAVVGVTAFGGGIPSYNLSGEGWGALAGLGVLSTGVGLLGGFYLVRAIGSVRTSLVTYIVPVAGLTLGWAVLGESLGMNVIGGLVLIAAGVTLVLRGGTHAKQPQPASRAPQAWPAQGARLYGVASPRLLMVAASPSAGPCPGGAPAPCSP